MGRHEARRCALQALYQIDVGRVRPAAAVAHVLAEAEHPKRERDAEYVRTLVEGTAAHREAIDELLAKHVQGWRLDRIAKVDLNVLRLAVYELMYERDVDVATIVDEAVELAKEFGTEASGRFVNGVLARVLPAATAFRA
ncbi:N utilization substance protein B [Alicyclobacillus cellulosilyticus]|uniref:Transcription antitermination protein NusB n=1 Tax=Alicyclobacillus cellulosilyticus TaxID=1003997 RepID=A0A917K1A2_9BACL|nr:transcription antitermination factor NusB [Alicyclobacillus cellulosilyticus]GGI95886.1 N utilization substance protein B [Alicyclobacillus cellulosilyticus]